MAFSRGENASSSYRWNCSSSKQQLRSELDLARRVCIGGVQKAGGHAILGSKDIDSNGFIRLDELAALLMKPSCGSGRACCPGSAS